MTNELFKIKNSFLCINFTSSICNEIDFDRYSNLHRIHIFVFNVDDVKMSALKGILIPARRRGVKIIVHCFKKGDIRKLKNQTKEVCKDQYFHFKLDRVFRGSYSDEKKIVITYRNISIVNNSNGKVSVQTIAYDYEDISV